MKIPTSMCRTSRKLPAPDNNHAPGLALSLVPPRKERDSLASRVQTDRRTITQTDTQMRPLIFFTFNLYAKLYESVVPE